jgi:DNA-binding HxlR family transcriptional regulator
MRDRHHFEELGKDEGIATNILSERLLRLKEAGLITKEKDARDGRQRYYAATERGADLIPTLLELGLWGANHAEHSEGDADLLGRTVSDRDGLVAELRDRALHP